MTARHRSPHTLSEPEAEQFRNRLRRSQARRDEARLAKVRRKNRMNRFLDGLRAMALFVGIVTFFTWIYWMAIHR